MAFPLLSVIVFLPLLGAMALAGVPREHVNAVRWGALGVMLVTFGISLALYPLFDLAVPGMQLSERVAWISRWGFFITLGSMASACRWYS
jgi:NADH-quinone oxidoreductase subunit M